MERLTSIGLVGYLHCVVILVGYLNYYIGKTNCTKHITIAMCCDWMIYDLVLRLDITYNELICAGINNVHACSACMHIRYL